MSWNYRVVRRIHEDHSKEFGIHEAYYDSDGKCHSITMDPVNLFGETLEELKSAYVLAGRAFEKPVLDYKTREEIENP